MTTLREAARQVLEALRIAQEHWRIYHALRSKTIDSAITALRAALALEKQEQEPVAWIHKLHYLLGHAENMPPADRALALGWEPLYTAPSRREWRGLTMQEINALPEVGGRMWNMGSAVAVLQAIRAVEAKLKEKNQ